MQTLIYDISFALRQLRKTPGLAVLAILTLALGVGANTAIFTVIESVLLRPLPYAHSDQLIYIGGDKKAGFATTSWLNYRDIRDQARQLSAVAGFSEDVGVLENNDASVSVVAPRITTNLIPMLGAKPLLGRNFRESEGLAGGAKRAVALRIALATELSWRSGDCREDSQDQRQALHGGRSHACFVSFP